MLTYSYQERSERASLHPKNYLWGLHVEKYLEYVDTNRNYGGPCHETKDQVLCIRINSSPPRGAQLCGRSPHTQ